MNTNEYGYYTSGIKIFVGGDSPSARNRRIEAIKKWKASRKEGRLKYGEISFIPAFSKSFPKTITTSAGYIKDIDFETMRADIWFNKELSEYLKFAGSFARIVFLFREDPHTGEILFCGDPTIINHKV